MCEAKSESRRTSASPRNNPLGIGDQTLPCLACGQTTVQANFGVQIVNVPMESANGTAGTEGLARRILVAAVAHAYGFNKRAGFPREPLL